MAGTTIKDKKGQVFYIKNLTREVCQLYVREILDLVNIIPYVNWTEKELFSDSDYFRDKWEHCFIVKNNQNLIIGVLIAYFRISDEKHILDSMYIHKIAISKKYQKKGIGTALLSFFIMKTFQQIPWLWNISLQTNEEVSNDPIIDFYLKFGFTRLYHIEYQNKTDVLMLLERNIMENTLQLDLSTNNNLSTISHLKHPRLNIFNPLYASTYKMPVLFFSSSNERKKSLFKFIFNNYNIDIKFIAPKINLTEPQIESADLLEEKNLVQFPLKLLSRFINHTPFIIEDTMLLIEFFNRHSNSWELPGHDTKRWWRQLGAQGILDIMENTIQRKAKFVSQLGSYIRPNEYCFGRGELLGSISTNARIVKEDIYVKGTYPYFFHSIFIPDGSKKTLAEMNVYEYARFDYIRRCTLDFLSKLRYSESFNNQITLF